MKRESSQVSGASQESVGREKQKLRTRRDLLAAARTLVDKGIDVTLTAVAEEAGVSRATVYRYFADPATLALECVLDGLAGKSSDLFGQMPGVRQRVHAVRSYWFTFYRQYENRLRILAARAVEPTEEGQPRYRRTARRLPDFVEALAPEADRLTSQDMDDISLALTAASGFDTYITMKDVLNLSAERIDDLSATIISAILDRYGIC